MIFFNNILIRFIIIIVIAIWVKPDSSTIDNETKETIQKSCEGIFAIFGFEINTENYNKIKNEEDLKRYIKPQESILDDINSLLVFLEYNHRGRSLNIREKIDNGRLQIKLLKNIGRKRRNGVMKNEISSLLEYYGELEQNEKQKQKEVIIHLIHFSIAAYYGELEQIESQWEEEEKKKKTIYSIIDQKGLLKYDIDSLNHDIYSLHDHIMNTHGGHDSLIFSDDLLKTEHIKLKNEIVLLTNDLIRKAQGKQENVITPQGKAQGKQENVITHSLLDNYITLFGKFAQGKAQGKQENVITPQENENSFPEHYQALRNEIVLLTERGLDIQSESKLTDNEIVLLTNEDDKFTNYYKSMFHGFMILDDNDLYRRILNKISDQDDLMKISYEITFLNNSIALGYKDYLYEFFIENTHPSAPVTNFCKSLINEKKFKKYFENL